MAGTDVMRIKITVNIFHCHTEADSLDVIGTWELGIVYITTSFIPLLLGGGGGV